MTDNDAWLRAARALINHLRAAATTLDVDQKRARLAWCRQMDDLDDVTLLEWKQTDCPMYDLHLVPPPDYVGNA